MRALVLALALSLAAGCGGVLVSARNILDSVATSAKTQEAALTQFCEAVADRGDSLEQCDAAYDLYEQARADGLLLKAELEKKEPDLRKVAELTAKFEASAAAFARAVEALLS